MLESSYTSSSIHFCPCPSRLSIYSFLFSSVFPSHLFSSLLLFSPLFFTPVLIPSHHFFPNSSSLFSSAGQDVIYTRIKAAQLLEDNLDNAKMAWGAWLGFYNGWVGTLELASSLLFYSLLFSMSAFVNIKSFTFGSKYNFSPQKQLN